MVRYWYCIYDPESRYHYNVHYSASFKTACANLRKELESIAHTDEYGRIYNEEPPNLMFYNGSTTPDSLMAVMEITTVTPKTIKTKTDHWGFTTKINSEREYILRKKAARTPMRYWPEYIVRKDGSLTAKKK